MDPRTQQVVPRTTLTDCVFITEMWSVHCAVRARYLYQSLCFIFKRFIWFME